MLVATGVLLGVVLLVMVGESVQELQLAGWLPAHGLGVALPGWVGLWFALFPTVEGVVAQAVAAALVLGSYVRGRAGAREAPARPGRGRPARGGRPGAGAGALRRVAQAAGEGFEPSGA